MTRKKGGGRESGGTDGGNRGAVRETSAAAYPAAHVHRIMNDEEPPYPEDCLPCAEREERIRALEAPAALRDSYGHDVRLHERIRALEAANKELTAMLYELRSQRDYAIAIQEDRER